MQVVSFREDIMDGWLEDPASASPVQISSEQLRTAALPFEPQAAQAVPHVSGTVTTMQSTASTVSAALTHALISATVNLVTTSDASNSGEVRVSFISFCFG